jgi:hypothetical protein
MAHSLGLTVVAEGIDTEAQIEPLRVMKCDQIQGFLFSPAVPADDARRFLARVGESPPVLAMPRSGPPGARPRDRALEEGGPAPLPDPGAGRIAASSQTFEIDAVAATPPPELLRKLLLVDDGTGALGPLALRLGRLGFDVHYAGEPDEGHLFVAQEKHAIRVLAISPAVELTEANKILDGMTRTSGSRPAFIALGEEPDAERRSRLREAGVDWVLWAPFNDTELRYLVKGAMAPASELAPRHRHRLPVDLTANLRAGDRQEVAVISSLSAEGAFIEMSDPFPVGSPLEVEFDLSGKRLRSMARVVHQQRDDLENPAAVSGIGILFLQGADRETTRVLLEAIREREGRYLP